MSSSVPDFLPPFELRWWPPFLKRFYFGPCRQRILIVADGQLNFDPFNSFGLSRLIEQLNLNAPSPTITTAHRSNDPSADLPNFRFDTAATPVTTGSYDQIWLFGIDPSTPQASFAPEVAVIAAFMNGGGGVFATGDHGSLGYNLCGELPRIRKMRDWQNTPMTVERIDTVTNPGRDRRTEFDDQSDELPQRIFPQYYGAQQTWHPHPLLRSPLGDIDVLPDHAHESQCYVGSDLHLRYTEHQLDFPEFPSNGAGPLAPEVVAWSVSAGRYLNPPGTIVGKPPTTPRLFGAIAAWDGQQVGAGRIVCDATWHHFVNINLDGTGAVPDAGGNARSGLRDPMTGAWTTDFHQIAEYYRNIVDWLVPVNRRWCFWWVWFLIELFREPLIEEWQPLPPHPCPWEPRLQLGALVESSFAANRGNGFATELAAEALTLAGLGPIAALVRPELATNGDKERGTLIDPAELRQGVVGSVFDALVRNLPRDPDELERAFEEAHDDEAIAERVATATRDAIASAWDHYGDAAERTLRFVEDARHRGGHTYCEPDS